MCWCVELSSGILQCYMDLQLLETYPIYGEQPMKVELAVAVSCVLKCVCDGSG